jgi:corrinoid protein of di/trimethylamine methyltransferase
MNNELFIELMDAMARLDEKKILECCKKGVKEGISAIEIINKGLAPGLEKVGKKFEEGEYFVTDLIIAGHIMKEAMNVLAPFIREGEVSESKGKIVIGTVEGDLHDIGKNIVVTLLRSSGFEVTDLGIDVPARKFVEEVKKGVPILGLSSLLTVGLDKVKEVVEELRKEGLKDKVKVIVGGAVVTEDWVYQTGVDAAVNDALEGIKICKTWIESA